MNTSESPQLGFLLSDWDEKIGPQIVDKSLLGISEDPETLATQSYISAQQVFCSVEFSRISYILPNLKIQRKVKLYFDVIKDATVRGGQRPFLVAVFLPLNIPDSFYLKIDPLIEPLMEMYKKKVRPNFSKMQEDARKLLTEYNVDQKVKEEETQKKEQIVVLQVHCEMCKRDLSLTFPKTELRKKAGSEFLEFTYLHGLDEKDVEAHGLRITVDPHFTLQKVEYVDVKGSRISPFKDKDLKILPTRGGTWSTDEVQTLAREMKQGTPIKSLVRLLQRSETELRNKTHEIVVVKLNHFNKVLATSIAEAKKVEADNPKKAKDLWLKIVEYCLEFAQSAGLPPQDAANIREKTRAIKARAENL
ncbi:MAG: hypothetical protein RBG13Loki_3406 [Promethearchaeota archaeon CR_4]|nr:MAG: hypothetical protein RBG13Loki_3406 [Candidatus Lokiarchaeota archaeon CR_4]